MKTSQRIGVLLAALLLGGIFAGGASAALKKYDLIVRSQSNNLNVAPNPNVTIPKNYAEYSVAVIDATGGPNPILRKLVRAQDQTTTTLVPSLAVNLFASVNFREGPGIPDQIRGNPVSPFTGTGNTAAGTTIRWGTVTGWTTSGSFWCNSNPSVLCGLAQLMDEATVDGRFNSEFYDLGTWTFHGTGFTASPFISSYATNAPANTTMWIRGVRAQDGTVPALSLFGVATLGASLVAGGLTALNRRRKP